MGPLPVTLDSLTLDWDGIRCREDALHAAISCCSGRLNNALARVASTLPTGLAISGTRSHLLATTLASAPPPPDQLDTSIHKIGRVIVILDSLNSEDIILAVA
eukprot:353880-Chlamydomonas_euryale.AAC.8